MRWCIRCIAIVTLATLLAPIIVTWRIQQITSASISGSTFENLHDFQQEALGVKETASSIKEKQQPRIFQDAPFMQDSCSQLLGNPFTRKKEVCQYVTCWTSSALQSSNCWLQNVTLQTDRFTVASGGVAIEHVLGQKEEDEFPSYSSDAWLFDYSQPSTTSTSTNSCTKDPFRIHEVALPHYLSQVTMAMGSHPVSSSSQHSCSYTILEPTFAITRYDYANLFHTMCDWYNFYQAIQIFDHRDSEIHVLLLDGHPAGNLDDSWSTVFGKTTIRMSDLKQYPTVCFRQLYLVGPGYNSPFFPSSLPLDLNCFGSIHVQDFAHTFLSKHRIPSHIQSKTIRIGFLFRKDYLAHPRQGSQPRVSRKIQNEEQLITEIQEFLRQQEPKAILIPLYLESLSLKQQLEHVAHLDILVGMHGAGLSHVLFMKPGSVLVELAPMSHAALNFFEIMAKVKGVSYMKQTEGIDNPGGGGGGEYYNIDTNLIVSTLKQALEQVKR